MYDSIVEESSTVSKAALFEQWKNLMKKIQPEMIVTSCSDAKQLARDYQMAKLEVALTAFYY